METVNRDRDEIAQTHRAMQEAVTSNRALIERTRVLIERIAQLLSGGGRSYPGQRQ